MGRGTEMQGCRGDRISIPIPIPYPQKILWVSPQDPHTHRTPKSYIPIPAPSFHYKRPHTHIHGNPHTHGSPAEMCTMVVEKTVKLVN